jgi:hypothetical protein
LTELEKFINEMREYKINTKNDGKKAKSKKKEKPKYYRKFTKE